MPSLGVWAQTHNPSEGSSRGIMDRGCVQEAPCSSGEGFLGENIKHGHGHGHHHHHHHHDHPHHHDHDGHLRDHHHMCPICLSHIEQSNLSVLRWCMHRFCVNCIQRWSLMQRFCPLCKQIFHGWYYNIRSSSLFDKKDLTVNATPQTSDQLTGRRRYPIPRLNRQPTSTSVRRSQPLPWRRPFQSSKRTAPTHFERTAETDEEALQWRASIYRRGLRAVPPHVNTKVNVKQAPANDPGRKARIEKRLEPWVRRELQAITGDSDTSILVHLVLSLWLNAITHRENNGVIHGSSEQWHNRTPATDHAVFGDAEAVRQLNPFLEEKASTFWHELKCFAESPYSLRAYDSVTKYEKVRE